MWFAEQRRQFRSDDGTRGRSEHESDAGQEAGRQGEQVGTTLRRLQTKGTGF